MTEELTTLLIIVAICVPTGLLVGILIRKTKPAWCKSYIKFCMNGKWWLFALGILMFLGASIGSFVQGRPYFGALFLLFVCLETFALLKYGFKSLTPEQEAKIDASDPSKFWPILFWDNQAVSKDRYFILFRKDRNVVAAEAPQFTSRDWPESLSIQGVEYLLLRGEDTFFFWDELRDRSGATVGYTIYLPESETFRESSFLRDSENVCMDGEDVKILLKPCINPEWECVQGFGSEIYANKNDETDCVIHFFHSSGNPVAFPVRPYGVTHC